MADVTITAANILIADNNDLVMVFGGESISIGELVFKSSGDSLYYLVDIDAVATAPLDLDGSEYGIAMSTSAAASQPVVIAPDGATVTFGAVLTLNKTYYGSPTPGVLTDTPPASGDFGVVVGTATVSTTLPLSFHGSGVATA